VRKISIGTLDYDNEELGAVIDVIRSGKLSAGDVIEQFECEMAQKHGKKYGIFVNSGQSALDVALILAKVQLEKSKLKVLFPATTYASDLWSIINTGNEPVFCDIDWNFVINYPTLVNDVYENIQEFDICLPVDLCGYPSRKLNNFYTIEDACEAVGNSFCNYGDIICLSFYVSHIITTGCGGMLCLDDERLVEYARSYISHGRKFGGDYTKFTNKWVDRFLFDKIGVSYRASAIEAALGIAQLKKISKIIEQRRQNARQLAWEISKLKLDYFIVPDQDYINKSVFQFFPIILTDDCSFNREDFLKYLFRNGIDSRVLLSLTNQPIIKQLYGDIESKYPVSEYCNKNGFIIGCHQHLTQEDLDHIATVFNNYKELE